MTIRVFVANTAGEWLPMKVLEFSIRETTRHPVEVRSIASFERPIPLPKDLRNQPRTPFSFQRFLIPELCGFQGRAIYLDADMQLFTDIGALWEHPMEGHDLLAVDEGNDGRRGQFSVMLLDCERLRWRVEDIVAGLDAGRFTYEQLMQDMCVASSVGRTLPATWNSLERHEPGVTRLLHYTDMNTQPWVSLRNPLGPVWVDCLRRAIRAGFLTEADVEREVAQSHVRPSLLAEIRGENRTANELRALDRAFQAPYKSIRSGKASPFNTWRGRGAAYARRMLRWLHSS